MLITLSSKNETDNSHFVNYFQDTIIFPPNSRVSLVNCSLVLSDTATQITISPGEVIDIMFDCWNIFSIPLVSGEYNLYDWIILQNATSQMTASNPIWYVEFEANDNILSLLFKRHPGPIIGGTPTYYLVWHAEFASLAYQNGTPMRTDMILRSTSTNETPVTYPTALSVGTNNRICAIKNADAIYDLAVTSPWNFPGGGAFDAYFVLGGSTDYWDYRQDRVPVGVVHYWKQRYDNPLLWDIWFTDPTGGVIPAPDRIGVVLDPAAGTLTLPGGLGVYTSVTALPVVLAGGEYSVVSHFNTSNLNWDYAPGGNKFDFNRWMGEFICQVGATCTTQMFLCDNDFNTATNLYTTNSADYLMRLDFGENTASGKFNVHRKDISATDVIVAADQEYRPGDFIFIRTEGAPDGITASEYCIGQHVRKLSEPNGLQLWIPMDLSLPTLWSYNSGQGNSGSNAELENGTNILQSINSNTSSEAALTYYNFYGLDLSKTGWRAGGGDPTNFIKDEYVGVDVEGLTLDTSSQMPNNGSVYFRRVDEQRLRLFENNGTQLVGTAESIDTVLPSIIMCTFKIYADAEPLHTLLGGTDGVLVIDTGSVANNVNYYDSAGTLYQTSFGAHQIVAGNWYTIGIATFGDFLVAGDPQIRILLMESNGNFHFTDTPTITTKPKNLRGINTIAGIFGAGGLANKYANAAICDFRYYQHNDYATITGTTYWDNIFQNIANFSVNTANAAVDKPTQWYGVLQTENVWTPSVSLDYNMAPPASGAKEMYQWYLHREAGENPNGDWFDHNMLNATSQNNYISGVQQKVVNAASKNALDIEGVALINVGKSEVMSVMNLVAPGIDYESKMVSDADPTNLQTITEIVGKSAVNLQNYDLIHNININNLSNNALDGNRKQISKTIYQIPAVCNERVYGDLRFKTFNPPSRVYLDLKNSDEIVLNQLEVQITKEDGTSDNRIEGTSNIVIEIN